MIKSIDNHNDKILGRTGLQAPANRSANLLRGEAPEVDAASL